MNAFLKSFVMVAFIGISTCAVAQTSSELELAKKTYKDALGRITGDTTDLQALSSSYLKSLEKLAQTLQKAGNLNGLIAVGNEKDRFVKDGTAPSVPGPEIPAELAALESAYIKDLKSIEAGRAGKIVALVDTYDASLEKLQKKMTVEGKIDVAMEVKQERETLKKTAVYVSATERLSKQAPPIAPPPAKETPDDPMQDIKKNLVLYYPFDANENRITDKSGKGNHGAVRGPKWVPNGKRGGALRFDGDNDSLNTKLNYSDNYKTFCLWAQSDKKGAVDGTLLGLHYPLNNRFYVGYNSAGDLGIGLGSSHINVAATSRKVDTDWHFYAATWDNPVMHLYVDGELVLEKSGDTAPKGTYFIGSLKDRDGRMIFRWRGQIDEVMIFSRVLSQEELAKVRDGLGD
jgi:hypothetical protein